MVNRGFFPEDLALRPDDGCVIGFVFGLDGGFFLVRHEVGQVRSQLCGQLNSGLERLVF